MGSCSLHTPQHGSAPPPHTDSLIRSLTCFVVSVLRYVQAIKQFTDYAWPKCASHWKLTFNYDSWYEWVWDSSYLPHGPVHSWIGGVGGGEVNGGCDVEFDEFVSTGLLNETDTTLIKMNM